MAHRVKCFYCQQTFDRDKVPYVTVGSRRYAHKECSLTDEEKRNQEELDKEALINYIMKLFNTSSVDIRIFKQIKQYLEEYNYTYSGIHKALIYFYEIKGNSIEKANGGIGIVPYIYQDAFRYYYSLWLAQQKNENKEVSQYMPAIKEIKIPRPERKVKTRKLFTFLDKEN